MRRTFNIDVDCALCAEKVEEAIKKIDGVKMCNINFITQKMAIEADDIDSLMKIIIKTSKRIEPDFEIYK